MAKPAAGALRKYDIDALMTRALVAGMTTVGETGETLVARPSRRAEGFDRRFAVSPYALLLALFLLPF